MKLTLHHINLSTRQVAEMDSFYREVIGLATETEGLPVLEKKKGYAGDVAFVSDGHICRSMFSEISGTPSLIRFFTCAVK